MRIMVYNILEGGLGRIDPICEVIRHADPDVIILPETLVVDEFQKLADRLKMELFQAESPRNAHGHIGLLTRLPLLQAVNFGPLDNHLTRAAFQAVVQDKRGPMGIIGVHLHAKESSQDEQIRLRELDAVLAMAVPFKAVPHIIAGDFNAQHPEQIIDLAKAPDFVKRRLGIADHDTFGAPLPRDAIAKMLAAGYTDAHAVGRQPAAFEPTFTTAQPVFRLDYIFVSPHLQPTLGGCSTVRHPMARFASDHFPIMAQVNPPADT